MLPNVSLNEDAISTTDFENSRAYSFSDSYVFSKNKRYNAMYEQNKDLLMIEHDAIKHRSANLLYEAFVEQIRMIDSLIVRIRNFTFFSRNDILNTIDDILPTQAEINKYNECIDKAVTYPKFKYLRYKIEPIKYIVFGNFTNLYKQELLTFYNTKNDSASNAKPILHDRLTDFIMNDAINYSTQNDSLLEMEELSMAKHKQLVDMVLFFERKSMIKTLISKDFKTYQYYLREYRTLSRLIKLIEPTQMINGNVRLLNLSSNAEGISFDDYLVIYKHFSSIIRSLLDIINYYDNKFYNKLYALQSNIQLYKSILDGVVIYVNKKDKTELSYATTPNSLHEDWYYEPSEYSNMTASLISGTDQAKSLLLDNSDEPIDGEYNNEEDLIDISNIKDSLVDQNGHEINIDNIPIDKKDELKEDEISYVF